MQPSSTQLQPMPNGMAREDAGQEIFGGRSQFDEVANPDRMQAQPDAPPDQQTQLEQAAAEEAMLHGLKQADVLKALEEGHIPQELWDKLKITQRVNGEDTAVTLAEYRENGMRLSDYTRAHQTLQTERAQFAETQGAWQEMVQEWRTPQKAPQTLEAMMDLGLPIHELAEAYATTWAEEQQLRRAATDANVPEYYRNIARQALEQKEALKAQREEHRRAQMQDTLSQRDQRAQVERQHTEAVKALAAEVPGMLQSVGVQDGPIARDVLKSYVKAMLPPGQVLTRQVLQQAVQATKEELSDRHKAYAAQQNQRQTPRLPVAAAAVGGVASQQRGGGTPQDFRQRMDAMRGRR